MSLVDEMILRALREDMPMGDLTTDSTIPESQEASARIIAKEDGVVAGLPVFMRVFTLLDAHASFNLLVEEGAVVTKGTVLMTFGGNARALLKAERTALNLLQRMSGIATMTHAFVVALAGSKAKIVDTRKTSPDFDISTNTRYGPARHQPSVLPFRRRAHQGQTTSGLRRKSPRQYRGRGRSRRIPSALRWKQRICIWSGRRLRPARTSSCSTT